MNEGFANALHGLRMDAGLTTAELAERVGLERWQIMEWECGESIPTTDEFVRLLDALGVSAERLMGGDATETGRGSHANGSRVTVIRRSMSDRPAEGGNEPYNDSSKVTVINRYASDSSTDYGKSAHDEAGYEPEAPENDEREYADEQYEYEEEYDDERDADEDDEADEYDEDDEADDSGDEPLLNDNVKVSFDRILRLAPFMSGDALGALARRAMEQETPDYRMIVKLAPFLPSRVLDEMVGASSPEDVDWELVKRLAPFLGRDTLARLADAATSGSQPDWQMVAKLAPFLPSKTLIDMANLALSGSQPDWRAVERLAPFLPSKYLDNLVISMLNQDGGWDE